MQPIRVLLVEDERIIALELMHQLRDFGYQVVGMATRGDQAIQRARELSPDLVLMDVNLEGDMDGAEAARTIHQKTRIPVVFMSAYTEADVVKRTQASLAYGYLVKPFNGSQLRATLQAALARRDAERAPRA